MNESHQLNVWTAALNLPECEVVHYAEREGVRCFSVVPPLRVELCPECSKPCERQHQKRWIEDVADLPLGDQPVRLKVRVYQYACDHCGRHFTPKSLLFTSGLGAKATARLVGKAAELIQRADIAGVAAFYQIPPKTLERWYYEWVEHQKQSQEEDGLAKPIRSLGIDELSLKKRHRQFVAVIIDHDNHRVLDVLESREKAVVKDYLQKGLDSGLFAEVEEVTTDMWDAYVNAAKEVFGDQARVTIDRFHVMKNFQERLTEARREIQRDLTSADREVLKGSRWLWLKNEASLSSDEKRTLKALCQKFPRLGQLHAQRESLRAIFEDTKVKTAFQGRAQLQTWLRQARSLSLKALDGFCQTLENWLELIANYFVERSSNGPTEGFNNGLRSLLRRAFGMQNFQHFRARVLHLFGKPQTQKSP